MSADSLPISAADFALAIHDLPLSSLYAKASELQNSLYHLRRSNEQLQPFADEGDEDCAEAIRENGGVAERFETRLRLLKEEVEGRGNTWMHGGEEKEKEGEGEGVVVNGAGGHVNGEDTAVVDGGRPRAEGQQQQPQSQQQSGRLGDDELRRLLSERLGEPAEDVEEDGGLHL